MREIKFRAWDLNENEYSSWGTLMRTRYNQDYYKTFDDGKIDPSIVLSVLTDMHIILEQYTGLKDKNGKEIYEGDIVAVRYTGGLELGQIMSQSVVLWGVYNIGCNGNEYDFTVNGPYVHDEYLYNQMNEGQVEILGNIHEHIHLLK